MVTIVITRDLHLLIIASSLFLTHECNPKQKPKQKQIEHEHERAKRKLWKQ